MLKELHSIPRCSGHFFTDERGEPNKFEFTIENEIPSHVILTMSLFLRNIFADLLIKDETKVDLGDCIMNSYVAISDEDYTIGSSSVLYL